MGDSLFSLGLIPVRDWISQARRSRDLRAGSVFLWHTMAAVLGRLQSESGLKAEIWLPKAPPGRSLKELAELYFSKALDEPYGIPNRASGSCGADPETVGSFFADLQEEVVLKAWTQLRDEGLKRLQKLSPDFWKDLEPHWTAYLDALAEGNDCPLTLVWVVCPAPLPLTEENRSQNLEAVDRLFADVKRTRPARMDPPGHPIGKCTQCGQREAIGPTEIFSAWRDWYQKLDSDDRWIQSGRRLDPGERLCYVCLVRRMAGYLSESSNAFPSTGDVAATRWLTERRGDLKTRKLIEQLEQTKLGRDDLGAVLYASKREIGEPESQKILDLRAEIRKQAPHAPAPPGYLALLAFDGDDMGRRVRENLNKASRGMSEFAKRAHDLLKEEGAAAFYLGGDEGLAMAPAETALALAARLRDAFSECFSILAQPPTLSLGMVFFEHSRPMRGAILAARSALDAAKAVDGKNALGVWVETASGNRWGYAAPWGEDWSRIQNVIDLIRDNQLSMGWAYDVERFLETLPEERWIPEVVPAARAEVQRLFLRRVQGEGETAEERQVSRLKRWVALPGDTWWDGVRGEGPNPQQFHLIGFLARQVTARPEGDSRDE